MKQFILPLVALMGMAAPALADTTTLGYVNPGCELTGDNGASKKDVWSSGAIFVPAHTLRSMAGSEITAIKVGLQSKLHIDDVKVWLRSDLKGENLAEGKAETVKKGWLEVSLDSPWTIPSDIEDGLYIGYSVHQTGASYALANTFDPVPGAWYADIDEAGWQDNSENGSLCLEAVVEGDALPASNLSILSIDAPFSYVVSRGTLSGSMWLKNYGTKDVSSFNVSMLVDGDQDAVQTIQVPIAAGGVVNVPFVLQPRVDQERNFEVTYLVDGINTGTDADMDDNSEIRSLEVVEMPVQRVVLIEEFTTEACPNCPPAATRISGYLHDEDFKDRLAVVCHHSGYGTDKFTTDFDKSYIWFYNSSSTYAPAMMVDRNTITTTPVMQVSSQSLERELTARIAEESQLGLIVEVSYGSTNKNQLNVVVKGKSYTKSLCNTPALTLWLVENGINSSTQSNGGPNYVHDHVGRDVNSTWGVPVEFNSDNRFEYKYTFNVSSNWNMDNLEVVAAVHNQDMSSPSNWEVENAAFVKAADFKDPTAVEEIAGVEEVPESEAEYYTFDGIRVDGTSLAPGMYVRKAGDKVTKIVIR